MKPMATGIRKLNIGTSRRILAVSDIHGCLDHLKNALRKAEFCRDDFLVIIGDMIVRGNDSLGTLRYVMELCEGGNAAALIGNMDFAWLEGIMDLDEKSADEFFDTITYFKDRTGTSFYHEMAEECGIVLDSVETLLRTKETVLAHFSRELDFLFGLDTVLEIGDYVFVHGGLRKADIDANLSHSVFSLTKYDSFMTETTLKFDKYVVVGHWPVNLYNSRVQQLNPVFNHEKKIIAIDGGCGIKTECQMNVLIIPYSSCPVSGITSVSWENFSKIRAMENQEEQDDSVHINWITRHIRVIEYGEEFSYIEHAASSRKLYVPNSYISDDNTCHDYTDRIIEVRKGDEISLICETSRGCIVKKNGVVGWYLGGYEKI